MCGIVGCFSDRQRIDPTTLRSMAEAIAYRGPDDSGLWYDDESGIGLAHRRLSILDLSPAGHQPMLSHSGRFVIVFNGEIYNHPDLRIELEKARVAPICQGWNGWRGHSDTETLLAGFEVWGIEATLQRSIGMFALAVWDQAEKTLTLARDRMGEKPLYYGWNQGAFLFASELKAFRAGPGFDTDISRNTLTLFMRYDYIPDPYSIYRGIFKLLPGFVLTLKQNDAHSCPWNPDAPPLERYQSHGISLRPFWSFRDVVDRGLAEPFGGTIDEAADELERVLTQAVLSQQISDVPLGAFLSGGVDSSIIVALMQAHSSRPVKTFTIGFHESDYNEAKHAKYVAKYLGTEHTELYVTPEKALAVIPRLPVLYDEPFSDSSQIPTFLVSQLTRQHVTVSLSGDAGDELFGGYTRYFMTNAIWRNISWLPVRARYALAGAIKCLSPDRWNQLCSLVETIIPSRMRTTLTGDKIHKLTECLAVSTSDALYYSLISRWKIPADIVQGGCEPPTYLTNQAYLAQLPTLEHRMMYLDTISYLPGDILVKVDRAAMAVSLETRVPFLDTRVIEFAWRLPLAMKVHGGVGKRLVRKVLYKYVPRELIERPKTGFAVPIDAWLRGPLLPWAEEFLDEGRLQREGYFNPAPIRQKWAEHLSGRRNWQYHLWDVLMFETWLDEQRKGKWIA